MIVWSATTLTAIAALLVHRPAEAIALLVGVASVSVAMHGARPGRILAWAATLASVAVALFVLPFDTSPGPDAVEHPLVLAFAANAARPLLILVGGAAVAVVLYRLASRLIGPRGEGAALGWRSGHYKSDGISSPRSAQRSSRATV